MSSDAKSHFSQVAKELIADGVSNPDLQRAIQAGFDRKEQFQGNWETVNLSEFVEKFVPNATRYVTDAKINFESAETGLVVVADVSGYCRLGKKFQGKRNSCIWMLMETMSEMLLCLTERKPGDQKVSKEN